MTAKEAEKVAILLGAARSAVSNLRWYAKDFDSCEIKSIADDLDEAIKEFNNTKKNQSNGRRRQSART